MKSIIIGASVGVLVLVIGYFLFATGMLTNPAKDVQDVSDVPTVNPDLGTATGSSTDATSTLPIDTTKTQLGTSVEGNPIMAYHFGEGEKEILFVGGIHGGYSWNTTLLAYEMMDYLEANNDAVPDNVKVTIIPVLNPDGLKAVVGTTQRFVASAVPKDEKDTIEGRFNAHTVDLNRNFDCEWQSSGTWQNRTVSGGSAAFSEPEAVAIRDYVNGHEISGAVVWYSAAGGVFASNCKKGVSEKTKALTSLYAKAAGYPAKTEFNFYEITGDMVNWLAKENVPAISVLLTNHTDTEWTKNKAGIEALLKFYAQE